MDTPPPIPPPLPVLSPEAAAKPSSFTLPLAAWIAWGLYAVVRVSLFSLRPGAATPYAIGEITGEIVATLLIAAVLALIVWRLGGRSARAGTITFFVVFAVSVVGQLGQFAQKMQVSGALAQLDADQKRMRAEEQQGRPIDPQQRIQLAEKASAQFGRMAENSGGSERALAEGSKAFMDQLLDTKRRYDAAVAELGGAKFWDLTALEAADTIAARRKAVRAFLAANEKLLSFQDADATAFRRELSSHGVPEADIRDAIKGYLKSSGPRLSLLAKIRGTDAQIGKAMLDFLDFAEASHGQWRMNPDNGKIIFQTQAALTTYQEITGRADAASTEQQAAQKQLTAPPQ